MEIMHEQRNDAQSYEVEAVKNKQLQEKAFSLQTQLTNHQTKVSQLERKLEAQSQNVENLKEQNTWLKQER